MIRSRWISRSPLQALLCLALCCASAGQAAAQGQTLTVERIYSQPSLSGRPLRDTSWSPDGKSLTYLEESAAETQIMAVDVGTGRSRVLVDDEHLRNVLLPPAS